jgi:hypothetical protein
MSTRTEIIAQIDDELSRLQRARDFLTAALRGSQKDLKIASARKVRVKVPAQNKQPAAAAAGAANGSPALATPAPAPQQLREEPQIQRVPPKRRVERRHLQTEKSGKSGAALSGLVPVGPVVVSANEARKVQERAVPPTPMPVISEARPEIGAERSLASLIQAFERKTGLSGLETP